MGRRARSAEAKAARRDAILDAARGLVARERFDTITMAGVAKEVGLAKGTVYLYFPTKESLFLEILDVAYGEWFDAVDQLLSGVERVNPMELVTLLAQSLDGRQLLTKLLVLLHDVLEQNIDYDQAVAFKTGLLRRVTEVGARIEAVLPELPEGSGAQLLMRLHALVVGVSQMAAPSPVVAEVLSAPEFGPLRVDFETTLLSTAYDLIVGMCSRRSSGQAGTTAG